MDSGLLILDPPRPGAENMAVDGQLLADAARLKLPILRVYSWLRPTLSLGYFQKLEEVADPAALPGLGVDWVRRATGGGAILHHREVTLSLSLPDGHPWLAGAVNDSYLAVTRPLVEALQELGIAAAFRGECPSAKPANCFAGAACPDVVVEGKKVFGSAQRRKGGAVLTHGSLLLDVDQALWQGVFGPRLGAGFAGVGHLEADWGRILSRAYSLALDLEWRGCYPGT